MRLCQYQEKVGFRKQAATTTVTTTTTAAAVTITTTIVRTTKKHHLQRESVALDWNGCGCYFRLYICKLLSTDHISSTADFATESACVYMDTCICTQK